uniref:Uncharacterized protein n=2 Tax=Oryza sativa subsp. japonica TaxID=39947 RepID=A0A5S6R9L9_ORYSJ|nr:hypothetical protein [Oryza sativa Japonica Group]AAN04154.1 Hypothetical protein [Oryza sativa Japonica Group]AAP53019.1 hypothetical protein LOC_Os10g18330 [Oryza sativa Japonica Group]
MTPPPSQTEISQDNLIPATMESLNDEQWAEIGNMVQQLQEACLKTFSIAQQGIVVQKTKFRTSCGEGEGSCTKDIKVEQDEEMQKVLTKFNQLAIQDHVDSAVNHALINQSRVLVNTLANLIKSVVDGSIAEHEERGSVYLPGGEFPNYRELKTSIGGGRFQDNNVMVSRSKQPPTSGVFGSNTMIPEKLAEILKSVIPGSTQPSATEPIARRPPVIPQPHTQQPSGQPIGSHTIRPQYCIQEPRTFSF